MHRPIKHKLRENIHISNKVLTALFFYNGIFILAATMLGPLYAVYVERFVDGIMAVSISWATLLISTTIFTYLLSRTGDKVKDKKNLLLVGYLLRIIGWISFIFVNNIISLVLVQILLGLGESLGTPAFNTIFAEHLDKNAHIKEYSNWTLVSNLFSALGIVIGGLIVNNFGFQPLFMLMSFLALLAFTGLLFQRKQLL